MGTNAQLSFAACGDIDSFLSCYLDLFISVDMCQRQAIIAWRRAVKKEVREAVNYAVEKGFTRVDRKKTGHVALLLRCKHGCCQITVNSTPQNPGNHAKMIKGKVDRCCSLNEQGDDDGDSSIHNTA